MSCTHAVFHNQKEQLYLLLLQSQDKKTFPEVFPGIEQGLLIQPQDGQSKFRAEGAGQRPK